MSCNNLHIAAGFGLAESARSAPHAFGSAVLKSFGRWSDRQYDAEFASRGLHGLDRQPATTRKGLANSDLANAGLSTANLAVFKFVASGV